jgi:hypothetical protein
MNNITDILLKKNLPHVITLIDRNGKIEDLDYEKSININEVIQGVAELNKNGLVIPNINVGLSKEGVTKISNISELGLFLEDKWITNVSIEEDESLPEKKIIPFKSDSWILGEFIVQHLTGKSIPKKFLKSQVLLDKFSESISFPNLKQLLVLDPVKRSYVWEITPTKENNEGVCRVM